jgi:hypothetical protein
MALLNEIYGKNFNNTFASNAIEHTLSVISKNIINNNFDINLDTRNLWYDDIIPIDIINRLINKIHLQNENYNLKYIKKNTNDINILSHFINDKSVEYFILTFGKNRSIFYITKHKTAILENLQ